MLDSHTLDIANNDEGLHYNQPTKDERDDKPCHVEVMRRGVKCYCGYRRTTDGHEGTTCMRLTDPVAEATNRQWTKAAAEATVRRGRSVIRGGSTPDILLAVCFLTTQVSQPDEDDWKKLGRCLQYLEETKKLYLTLEADSL